MKIEITISAFVGLMYRTLDTSLFKIWLFCSTACLKNSTVVDVVIVATAVVIVLIVVFVIVVVISVIVVVVVIFVVVVVMLLKLHTKKEGIGSLNAKLKSYNEIVGLNHRADNDIWVCAGKLISQKIRQ